MAYSSRRKQMKRRPAARTGRRLQQDMVVRGQRQANMLVRAMPYAAALARGVGQAYRANRAIQQANQAVRAANEGVRSRKRQRAAQRSAGASRVTKGTEISWSRYRGGPGKSSRNLNTWKLQKLLTFFAKQRYQNVAPIDRGVDRGANFLGTMNVTSNAITSAFAGGGNNIVNNISPLGDNATYTHIRLPFHMFLLNGSYYSSTLGLGTSNYSFQPFLNRATGQVDFSVLGGTTSAGDAVNPAQWFDEVSNQVAASQDRMRFEQMCWYQIKLGLRNAPKNTTYFDVMIVGFRDDHLDPLSPPLATAEQNDRRAFYAEMAAAGTVNPLVGQDAALTKVMKRLVVYKKLRVVMDKQQTTDSDVSPDLKVVNLFYRDGKMYDYHWNTQPMAITETSLNQVYNQSYVSQQTIAQAQPYPKTRARKWLIVRAFAPGVINAGPAGDFTAPDYVSIQSATCPSYDICIKRKVVTNA